MLNWSHKFKIKSTSSLKLDSSEKSNILYLYQILWLYERRMAKCRVVNFKDLNNMCSKYEFPLPILKIMIDATTSHEVQLFLDGSPKCNQISMALKDQKANCVSHS